MELRRLRYFVAVAEERDFRRAAERLHLAQPAISEEIYKLEDELGVRLLDRSQGHLSLTDAGAALLPEARCVMRGAELARLATQNARDRATDGPLGSSPALSIARERASSGDQPVPPAPVGSTNCLSAGSAATPAFRDPSAASIASATASSSKPTL
jgi:DNA-binding MarR family transcriptional regulator